MSWYSTPIQPIDPVVVSQQPKPAIRYVRDNFLNTGQNSYLKPPAQDPAMWQSLVNIQPITNGNLNRRWGYQQFTPVANTPDRLSDFQSDANGTRAIVATGIGGVSAFTESGTSYNPTIFTPEAGTGPIRSITSRNFQYFCDGVNALDGAHRTGDSLKWDGSASGGVTNIGIVATDVTQNTSAGGTTGNLLGPNTGTTVTDVAGTLPNAWSNPSNILNNNPIAPASVDIYETMDSSGTPHTLRPRTDYLQPLQFFSSTTATSVIGLQVAITCKLTVFGGATFPIGLVNVQIVKNGVLTGTAKTANVSVDGNLHTITLGSASDLWGGAFAPVDLVQANFGCQFYFFDGGTTFNTNPSATSGYHINVSYITITATLSGGTGSATTSGNGVGILGAVAGGNVNLTLGRTYYLVANTATVGHFSDLTVASTSTGPSTSSEFNLLLATFNDPQVDTKYVLATADGGDPSILYETSVLIPGLTVSSWAIVTNVVTFTGTFFGTAPANGATVVVGGLSHGSYMNGQTLTVTSTTATTLVAAFTHGNDSATERGIVGNYGTSVPNGVFYVVDNQADPDLVLQQPLLFTDQFGSEFGVALNTPPPAGNLLIKHQGRLWMAGVSGATHSVYFSKSVSELTLPNGFIAGKYEESWPLSNYFDVSDGAESVNGLLSDGTTLYIGTQNHIRRLLGNSPVNFQEPQIVHPQVGLMNQEVWQIVFMQGAPSGSIWVTPDYRVIQSDFNTYVDIGHPIQDILNSLQPTAATLAHGVFVADGEFDLYILAVPYRQSSYCDTHLVYDLRNRQWFVWQPADGSLSTLFNITAAGVPQWLFIDGTGQNIDIYSSSALTDRGVAIPLTATTAWLHLGEPTRRKVLNELQIYGNTNMAITVQGANNLADFSAPLTIIDRGTLYQSPFDTWNLYLTSYTTRHRYYQFTFTADDTQTSFLGSYAIASMPLDDL